MSEAVFGPDMNRLQNGAVAAEAEVWGTASMLGPESRTFMRRRELDILGNVVLKVEEVSLNAAQGPLGHMRGVHSFSTVYL